MATSSPATKATATYKGLLGPLGLIGALAVSMVLTTWLPMTFELVWRATFTNSLAMSAAVCGLAPVTETVTTRVVVEDSTSSEYPAKLDIPRLLATCALTRSDFVMLTTSLVSI